VHNSAAVPASEYLREGWQHLYLLRSDGNYEYSAPTEHLPIEV
jgi:hypothetical protein